MGESGTHSALSFTEPMKPKQSSQIVGNLAPWVVVIVATFAVLILALSQ